MTTTYDCIATTTLGTAQTSITFSNVSQNYTDLVLICSVQAFTNAVDIAVRFNGDTGSNYSTTTLYGTGTSAGATRTSNGTFGLIDFYGYAEATNWTVNRVNIMNYSNTTTFKTYISRADNSQNGTNANVGLWRNTAAITSITVTVDNVSKSLSPNSIFTLYGIKAE